MHEYGAPSAATHHIGAKQSGMHGAAAGNEVAFEISAAGSRNLLRGSTIFHRRKVEM
jgi:hypothetical protein